MERIEIPAEVYFKAKDGKRFRNKEDCEKWETLYDKWTKPEVFREFENEEGQLCYAFWVESKEEIKDVLWFFDHKMHTCTRNSTGVLRDAPQWFIMRPYYDGYNSDYEIMTVEDFRELLDETLKAVQDTISEVVKLTWEKA